MQRQVRWLGLLCGSLCCGFPRFVTAAPATLSDTVRVQIHALQSEKASRTPAQQKLDSQFVLKLKQDRHQWPAEVLATLQPDIEYGPDGRILVDIDATVTAALLAQIDGAGGAVVNSFPRFRAIRAWVTLDQMEALAASPNVKGIHRAAQAACGTGSVDSEGDTTHAAISGRSTYGVAGAGVKVGILSDSVDHLANSQASGDLPTNVIVLTGQSGTGHGYAGEGTAMLEIVHDLAPAAQLYFATAFNSEASFAQNILDLRSAGCDIIADDVFYYDEPPFQDGIVAQAVNTVTADGAWYFSLAGNGGSLQAGTSATWEGDFVDGGPAGSPITDTEDGRLHSFGATTYNTIQTGGVPLALFWADPLGASSNDYDLFILNSSGTSVIAFSNGGQSGAQDPYEWISGSYAATGNRAVIVKYSGAARFLHLKLIANGFGRLALGTTGCTRGHQCAVNALGVAAVSALAAYPSRFTSTNVVETFSSDGPRRVFFNADGSAITPENFSSTGGLVRQKPDIAAADGVTTTVSGFHPFYGTSAATPHAAAIAALLKSFNPGLTLADVRSILVGSALDIMAPGRDINAGAGIVMAPAALREVTRYLTDGHESAGNFLFRFATATNQNYTLQRSADPRTTNWITYASFAGSGQVTQIVTRVTGAVTTQFYRVRQP